MCAGHPARTCQGRFSRFNRRPSSSLSRPCVMYHEKRSVLDMGCIIRKEELPHSEFQTDFLRPFKCTKTHNANPETRDVVLQCLQQMIQNRTCARVDGQCSVFSLRLPES
ncbi:hypothetical protein DFH94DRAFT_231536 [Russula ochroleuca]|uniref:Mon2/Sec7/BIG1-like HDS domain-containing protein n=1 Tax=Russula ochroleuca TaxID=152965 RepID=A0A9P5JYK3_9AGAM|nr:hypothetical protein DFH94DRAFT_231536 [Russula ochroleuca]